MADQLYALSEPELRTFRKLAAMLPELERRLERPRRATTGPNVQLVKASSATPTAGRYPGHWYDEDQDTHVKTQKNEVWITTPNGTVPNTAKYYEASVQHGLTNGRPVFAITDHAVQAAAGTPTENFLAKWTAVNTIGSASIASVGDGAFGAANVLLPAWAHLKLYSTGSVSGSGWNDGVDLDPWSITSVSGIPNVFSLTPLEHVTVKAIDIPAIRGAGNGITGHPIGGSVIVLFNGGDQDKNVTLAHAASVNNYPIWTMDAADLVLTPGASAVLVLVNNNDFFSPDTYWVVLCSSLTVGIGDGDTLTTGLTFPNVGLGIKDTDASHKLILKPGSNQTADRTFTFITGDADRTLDISAGSVTITAAGAALTAGADATAQRLTLGLVIGTNVQAQDAFLQDIADLTDPGADRFLFWDDSVGEIAWAQAGGSVEINSVTAQLVNDSATPGNSKYYGTDSGGTKGFFDLPSGGGSHALLSATHTDTTADTVVRGDLITGQTGPTWKRLALGAVNSILYSDGNDVVYLPSTAAGILVITQASTADIIDVLNVVPGVDVQAFDAQLSSLAALTYAGNALKVVRVNAGESDFELVAPGTGSQPLDATLTAFAALTIAANSLTIGTGADAFSQTTFAANTFPARASTGNLVAKTITDFALTILDDTTAGGVLTTLGGTTVGQAVLTTANPSAITFLRANADNTVTWLSAADYRTALGVGTGDSPEFTAINLGHASDTTLARVSAGVASIEGVNILTTATGQPLDATLTALAGLTIAANSLSIGSGADAFSQVTFAANTFPARASTGNLVAKSITDFGLSLVDDADAAAGRATLEIVAASDTAAGLIEIAVQSEQETGTDVVRAVTPGRQHFHKSALKAWIIFDGTTATPTVRDSCNIASITDNGVGDWTLNIATDFASAFFCATWGYGNGVSGGFRYGFIPAANDPTAGTIQLRTWSDTALSTLADTEYVSVMMAGDQA